MKKNKIVYVFVGLMLFASACRLLSFNSEVSSKEKNYSHVVDSELSEVHWKGSKKLGSHRGEVAIKRGKLGIDEGKVVDGYFEIDMLSISVNEELAEDYASKLIGHLSSVDFFEVEKYTSSTLKIESVTRDSITALLRIRDVTRPITFPYTMNVSENAVNVESSFAIDRTDWGINYNSPSKFQDLGDYAIDDQILFEIKLTAMSS